MGTRADFYVGRGESAEWLGSIAWDGFPEGLEKTGILEAVNERQYRAMVTEFIAARDDGTSPECGWPWPWDDSGTTDWAYAFEAEKVWASHYGHTWHNPLIKLTEEEEKAWEEVAVFPNMSKQKNVTVGPRSGLIVIVGASRRED